MPKNPVPLSRPTLEKLLYEAEELMAIACSASMKIRLQRLQMFNPEILDRHEYNKFVQAHQAMRRWMNKVSRIS